MPRVSAKRKALSALNRLKGLKRQSKGREKQRNEVEPLPAPPPATADPPPFPPPSTPHVSAASFRHSLLPDELRETSTVSDNSALLTISLERLQAVLDLVNCVECGNKCVTKITTQYFDCTFSLRCEDCSVIIHHSQPKKCQDNNFSEGNIMFVYHSLSEGYGRAGLSRLSTAMGSKEMSSATFMQKAEFIYSEMNSFYDEHTRVVKDCVERLYEKKYEDKVRDVYHDLSSPALLQKCLKGESQNRNEGFHSKLWFHQSKAKFAGMKRVKFVSQLTVIDHNFGYMANKFLQHLGFSATTSSLTARQRMDKRKITPRKKSKAKKRKTAPGPDYQPGGF